MTKNDVLSTILGIAGAEKCRANKTNFIAIPTEDGIVKVSVGTALAEDTKNHKAFNFEAAKADYKAWEAESALRAAERANKPAKVKGPNPEAEARRQALDAQVASLPSFTDYTATDILNALAGQVAENVTVMAVGSSAMRLVEKGLLTMTLDEKKKKHYTKG
jgi:sRNA-binding protein